MAVKCPSTDLIRNSRNFGLEVRYRGSWASVTTEPGESWASSLLPVGVGPPWQGLKQGKIPMGLIKGAGSHATHCAPMQ